MKNFAKYCYEVRHKYYNCDKVLKVHSILSGIGLFLIFISIIPSLYFLIYFGLGCFLFVAYSLYSQKKFWRAEVPYYVYHHFNNMEKSSADIMLKIMHKNNSDDPKLTNLNIFFPTVSMLISLKTKTHYSLEYCQHKTKLDDNIHSLNSKFLKIK